MTVVSPPPPQLPPGHDVTVTVDVVYVVSWYVLITGVSGQPSSLLW